MIGQLEKLQLETQERYNKYKGGGRMEWTKEEMDKAINEFNAKAKIDQDFRILCMSNPLKALEVIIGQAVPEGLFFQFFKTENRDSNYLALNSQDTGSLELSEAELEQVSAGAMSWDTSYLYCSVCKLRDFEVIMQLDEYWNKFFARFHCNNCGNWF